MIIEAIAIAAAVTAAPTNQPGYGRPNSGVTHLAECSPSRPITGNLWQGQVIIGGMHSASCCGCEEPGPCAYGARGVEASVPVQVGQLRVPISPWKRWNDRSYRQFEAARQQWLRENGYVGEVRTFMNDLVYAHHGHEHAQADTTGIDLTPKATIVLPADMPRMKSRMQVEAPAEQRGTIALTPRVIKVLEPGVKRAEVKIAAK